MVPVPGARDVTGWSGYVASSSLTTWTCVSTWRGRFEPTCSQSTPAMAGWVVSKASVRTRSVSSSVSSSGVKRSECGESDKQ